MCKGTIEVTLSQTGVWLFQQDNAPPHSVRLPTTWLLT